MRPFRQNIYITHSIFCKTEELGWKFMLDISDYKVNHRNLFLDSSVELDEMNDQYDHRPAFLKLSCRTLDSPRFNNITISNHVLGTLQVLGT